MGRYLISFPFFQKNWTASQEKQRKKEVAPVPTVNASLEREADRLSKEIAAEAMNDDDLMKALLAEFE